MFDFHCAVERKQVTGTDTNGRPITRRVNHYANLACSFPQEKARVQDEEPDAEFIVERYTVRVPLHSDIVTGDFVAHVRYPNNIDTGFGELEVLRATPRRTHLEVLCRRSE